LQYPPLLSIAGRGILVVAAVCGRFLMLLLYYSILKKTIFWGKTKGTYGEKHHKCLIILIYPRRIFFIARDIS